MRIALCFSGQPRFINECAPHILQNVCGNHTVDVFAHFWFDKKLQTEPYKFGGSGGWEKQRISESAIDDFIKYFNPVDIQTEPDRFFTDSSLVQSYMPTLQRYKPGGINNPLEPNFAERDIKNIISYYYSLNQVAIMKRRYEYLKDFRYDMVVKMRSDAYPTVPVDFSRYDPSCLYFSGLQNQPDGMINDWFNFSSSDNMDVFMGSFLILERLIKDCQNQTDGAWCCELIHRKMVDFFNIQIQPLPLPIYLPRF
jgi:hypothetical protein